jgi:hypothetical protein
MEAPNNAYWLNVARDRQIDGPRLAALILTRAVIATLVVASAITAGGGVL